jgi:hypothetical protein
MVAKAKKKKTERDRVSVCMYERDRERGNRVYLEAVLLMKTVHWDVT